VKFAKGIYFDGRNVLSWVLLQYPDPRVRVALTRCGRIYSFNRAPIQKLYKTKVVGQSCFIGGWIMFLGL